MLMKKRFTLMLLAALVAVTSFAQPVKRSDYTLGKQVVRTMDASTVKRSMAKKAPRKAAITAADIAGAYTATIGTATDYNGTVSKSTYDVTLEVNDAGNITISGFGFMLPFEAKVEVEESLETGEVTTYLSIASDQPIYNSSYGACNLGLSFYYEGDDTYEAGYYGTSKGYADIMEDGSIVFDESIWLLRIIAEGENEGYYLTPMIAPGAVLTPAKPAEDVPAMPADPSVEFINDFDASEGYGSIGMIIPTVSVDGEPLVKDKLYYQLYREIGGVAEPVTFTPDLYIKLESDMSIIPYSFTDDWDFQDREGYKLVFINEDFSNWERIGVKSIYWGGDEYNETDIIWYAGEEQPDLGDLVEAQWVAGEQGYTNGEDVTAITIGDDIAGVFAQEDGKNAPKYYDTKGEAVRMYAGNTLTISSADYPIRQVVITLGSRTDLDSEDGNLEVDGTTATWTGNANEVVFYVPTGLTPAGQAYILAIDVFYEVPLPEPQLIELPEGAEVEEWNFVATQTYEGEDAETGEPVTQEYTVDRSVNVAFVGDEVYFQGLSESNPEAWVVGTLADGVVTIPASEYLGDYEVPDYGLSVGLYTEETTLSYNADKKEFTTEALTIDAEFGGSVFPWEEYSDVTIYFVADVAAVPANPEILYVELADTRTEEELAADDSYFYPYIILNIPSQDTEGNSLALNKLFYHIYVNRDGVVSDYVFTPDYYYIEEDMPEVPYSFADGIDFLSEGNLKQVYVYDEAIAQWGAVGVQSVYYGGGTTNSSPIVWYDLADYWESVGIDDVVNTSVQSVKYYDLQGRAATAGTKGIVIAVKQMADGTIKTQKMLRK